MKTLPKFSVINVALVILFLCLFVSSLAYAVPQDNTPQVPGTNSAMSKKQIPPADSLAKIACDKKCPFFINLDPDSGQVDVPLNSIIKFTVVDSILPKKNEWDHFGVDISKIFISIKTRFWEVDKAKPHKISLTDSIQVVDCEYYPEQPFDWSDTVTVTLFATDISYLKNEAKTTYVFYTSRDGVAPVLTPIYPQPSMIEVPIDSGITIHGTEEGRGIDWDFVRLWINGIEVEKQIVGDRWSFHIYYKPEAGWKYNNSIQVKCEAKDLDGNRTELEYWFKTKQSPARPVLISPENNSTNLPTSIEFVWHESDRATGYQFQLSEKVSFDSLTTDSTGIADTTLNVIELSRGTTYYWRVKASNAAGWSEWSEVWNFTTAGGGEPPLPPILISPPDDSTGLDTSVTFLWQASDKATGYQFQLSVDSNFVSDSLGLKDTTLVVTGLLEDTTYYWRVKASNAAGWSEWSAVWQFTTRTSGGGDEPPLPPVLISPPNNSTKLDTSVTFLWHASDKATGYQFQLSVDSNFVSDSLGLTDTTLVVTGLLEDTTYYWRVKASDAAGWSEWSAVWQFTTRTSGGGDDPLLPPVLISPPNNSTELDTSVTFLWHASDKATGYQFQLSEKVSFDSFTTDRTGLAETTLNVIELSRGTTYYWRVNASNAADTSDWSEVWHFTTDSSGGGSNPPLPPELISPPNESAGLESIVTFLWHPSDRAKSYRFQLSIDASFSSMETDSSGLPNATEVVSALSCETKYYWRVNASNEAGTSAWSDTWNFCTKQEPIIYPDLWIFNFISSPEDTIFLGETLYLKAYIKCSFADISDSFSVSFYRDDNKMIFKEKRIDGLQKDETKPVETTLIPKKLGNLKIQAFVDCNHNIDEQDEVNNLAEVSVVVIPVKSPELIVRSNPFTPNQDGFNDEVKFDFEQFDVQNPNLKIFDIHGKRIKAFEEMPNGGKAFFWNGLDETGRQVLPGAYLYVFSDKSKALARGCVVVAR